MQPFEYRKGQRESLTTMDDSFWERLTGSRFIARGRPVKPKQSAVTGGCIAQWTFQEKTD